MSSNQVVSGCNLVPAQIKAAYFVILLADENAGDLPSSYTSDYENIS